MIASILAPVLRAVDEPWESMQLNQCTKHEEKSSTSARHATQEAGWLPEVSYPSPFCIKNTFIDLQVGRGLSLEGFFEERVTRSCPGSGIEAALESHGLRLPLKPQGGPARGRDADGSACSRSTSAGSSPRNTYVSESSSSPALTVTASPAEACGAAAVVGLPEMDYPSLFSVKNTFVHADIGRPLSLDGFYTERMVHSCPASGIDVASADEELHKGTAATDLELPQAPGCAAVQWPSHIPPPPMQPLVLEDVVLQQRARPAPPFLAASSLPVAAVAPVLLLAEAIPPVLGSVELPTVGSADHGFGTCRPCAHAHSAKGCMNGVHCSFCHLCPAGELKRRQREKRLLQRRAERAGRAV